ncbi:tetratricopeptide repeat protein 28-like [Dendronephthya gigantea]|uniref:tetratricopeptide repeat protein 28-like n=1 Tax=Dendronephthya gigantea TaxID=151771 RepID=UPI00106CF12B|nr:tetratricopeptide repeat protein 28-like [Dendronephthya gigantea]
MDCATDKLSEFQKLGAEALIIFEIWIFTASCLHQGCTSLPNDNLPCDVNKEGVILVIFVNGRIKHEKEPRDLDIEAFIGDLLDELKKDPGLDVLEYTVIRAFGPEKHDQEITNIEKGSLLVSLHCFTDERFLEVLDDFESKRLQESFLRELSLIGIEMEGIELKILNMEEVNKKRNAAKTKIAIKEGSLEETEESKSKGVMEPKELNIGKLEDIRMTNHLEIATCTARSGDNNLKSGKYKEAIECYETAIESLTKIEDLELAIFESALHTSKGEAYIGLKEYQNAIACFKKGFSLSDDRFPVAISNEGLGRVYFELGQYEEAINSYKIALDASTAIGDKARIANIRALVDACYEASGEERRAIEYLKKGLEGGTASDDRRKIAVSHRNLCDCNLSLERIAEVNRGLGSRRYCQLERNEEAVQCFEQMLRLMTVIGDKKGIADAKMSLGRFSNPALEAQNSIDVGNAYVNLGHYDQAIDCFRNSLQIATAIGNQYGIARANMYLGDVYKRLKDYEKAISYLIESLKISTTIGNTYLMAESNRQLGNIYYSLGKGEIAISHWKKALELGTAIDNQGIIAKVNHSLSYTYVQLGRNDEALLCLEEALRLMTAIDDQKGIAGVNMSLGRFYQRTKDYKKAISFWKVSLEISTAISDQPSMAEQNRNLGDLYRCIEKWESAIDHYKKTLELGKPMGDQEKIADVNCNLGNCYSKLESNEEAVQCFEEMLRLMTAIGDQKGIAHANMYLGDVYERLKDYEKAISCLKESLEITTTIGDTYLMAESNRQLANNYYSLGKWEIAIYHWKKTLELGTAIGNQGIIAKVNHSLSYSYVQLGRNDEALSCLEEALRLMNAIDDQKGIADANMSLGRFYQRRKDYEKAISYLKVSLEISTAISDQSSMAEQNRNLGDLYRCKKKWESAIDHYKKTLEIGKAMGDQGETANVKCNLGICYIKLKRNEEALQCFKETLRIFTAIGHQEGIAENNAIDDQNGIKYVSNELGRVHQHKGEYSKAIEWHRKSLEIAKTVDDQAGIVEANCDLSLIYQRMGEDEKAISYIKEGSKIAKAIIDKPFMIIRSYEELANVFKSLGEYKVASSYLVKLIKLLEEQFQNKVPDENKLSFTSFFCRAHGELMSCFVSLGRIESGLLVTDLGRAKELHFSIERKRNNFDAELSHYARSIWSKIEKREENREIERIQNILQVKNNEISIVLFAFDFNEGSLKVWVLNSDVTFKCSHDLSIIWAFVMNFSANRGVKVNRDSSFFKLDSLANEHSFESHMISPPTKPCKRETLEDLHEKHLSADSCSDENSLKKLFDFLIQPIRDAVKGNKLIVVPHGPLFFVPFSSLIDENGRYLSQSYSIQVTPSLHTLTFTKEQPHDYEPGFALFVGNPKVGHGKDVTPLDLPKAAEEVASLSKLFTARPLVNAEAKKQVVLGLLSGASIIHIAAHGEPKNGEIMLAPDLSLNEPSSSPPNPDSYLLTQNDIMSISLQARLVVLCCCHTGLGEISSGDIGIALSFLAAGARSVLATLWPISDDATKDFMEAFYGELLQKTSVCEALRRVMNLFQQHERGDYRSFFIWALFTLYGEDVMFTKGDIEMIREKSSETLPECGFALFVGNPTSDLPKATEEVHSLSKLFNAKAFVEGEARKQVLLGLLSGASIIHISAHIEPKQCAIMLSPCVSSNQASSTLPDQDDFLTQKDVQGLSLKARLVVLCLRLSEQDEISPEGVKTLALSFLSAGARSVLTTLSHSDDDATTEFIKGFYNHLLHESSVKEALEKTKKLFEKHDKESHRSIVGYSRFTIYGKDVMFQKHDIETIRKKSHKMFSGFVVLPTDDLNGSFQNFNLLDKA